MAGRNLAGNLTGLFANMQQGLSGEGQAGMQFVDSLRNSFAPQANANDANSLQQYSDWARRNQKEDVANQYMQMAQTQAERERVLSEENAARQGDYSISVLQNRMTDVLRGNPPDAEAQLSALQEQINAIARGVPGLKPSDYADSRTKASADYRQAQELASRQDARATRLENELTRMGFAKDVHYWTGKRFEQWNASQAGEEQLRSLQIEAGKLQAAANATRLFLTKPNGKQEYLEKFPEYGSLFDIKKQEHDLREAQLEEIKSRTTWDYSLEDLKTILVGFPEEEREKQAKAVMQSGSQSAAAGRQALAQAYQSSLQNKDAKQALNGVPPKFLMDAWRPLVTSMIDAELAGESPLNLLQSDRDSGYYGSEGKWASNMSTSQKGVLINETLLRMAGEYAQATSNIEGMNMAVLSLMASVTDAQTNQQERELTPEEELLAREKTLGINGNPPVPQQSGVLSQ